MPRARRIKKVERLIELALERKSVSCPNWDIPCPAAFIIGMQLRTVMLFMRRGLYEYKKKESKCQLNLKKQ